MGFGRRSVLDYTQSKLIHLCVMAQNGWGDFPARFFMHTDAERKYAVGAARVRRASRGKNRSPHSIIHGRGEEICSRSCPRPWKFVYGQMA